MDMFDITYFVSTNLISIIGIFCLIAYWNWQIKVRNENIERREQFLIMEKERQKQSLQMAVQKYERENEKLRELQAIIESVQRENKTLRASTKKLQSEMEQEKRRSRAQNNYKYQTQIPKPNYDLAEKNIDIFEILDKTSTVIGAFGSVALLFLAGKKLF